MHPQGHHPTSATPNPSSPLLPFLPFPQEAKAYCREIISFLRTLKANRNMDPNEAKLVVAIEDPAAREKRKLGIEVGNEC